MANRLFKQFFYSFNNKLVGLHGSAVLQAPVLSSVVAQGMTYTAKALGVAGDGITVTLTTGGTAGAEVVTVVGSAISVQIQSATTTQTQLKTAIDGAAAAAALISVSVASGGTAVAAAAAVTTSGGVAMVASFSAKGVASIAHSGTGEITITLQDVYTALESCNLQMLAATAVDLVPQIKSESVASGKTIVVRFNAGATPTNIAAAAKLHIGLRLRGSAS